MTLKAVLVNSYEQSTDSLLTSVAEAHGDRLLTKVRLADVVDIDDYTGETKSYGFRAHLDFVMVDSETFPRFAVELDGKRHCTDPKVRERDLLKDSICEESGLPLLRITSEFICTTRGRRALSYIIDSFYFSEAIHEAQGRGAIPLDEPFDIGSRVITDASGQLMFDTLDQAARLEILNHWRDKRLPSFTPDEFVTQLSHERQVQAHAFLAVATDRYLIGRVQIRDFRFQGITPSDVAGQLAVAEVGDLADRWVAGEGVACNGRELARYMFEVQQAIDAGGLLRLFDANALSAGGLLPADAKITFGTVAT